MAKAGKIGERAGRRGPRACSARAIKRCLRRSKREIFLSVAFSESRLARAERSGAIAAAPIELRLQIRELGLALRGDRRFKIQRLWRALKGCPDAPEAMLAPLPWECLLSQSFELCVDKRGRVNPGAGERAHRSAWEAMARFGVDFTARMPGGLPGFTEELFELKALSEGEFYKSGAARAALLFWKSIGGAPKREGARIGAMEKAVLCLGAAKSLKGLKLVQSVWPEVFGPDGAKRAILGLAPLCDEVESQARGGPPSSLAAAMSRHTLSLVTAAALLNPRGAEWVPADGSLSKAIRERLLEGYVDLPWLLRAESAAAAREERAALDASTGAGLVAPRPPRM